MAAAARAERPTRRSRRRSAARVGTDAWQLEQGEVEEVPAGARASEDPVAIDRADPLSPLTFRAIKATADVIVPPSDGVATVVLKICPIPLQMEDFQLALPNQWFNDELFNAYVELLRVRQLKFASSERPKPQYIFFISFLYESSSITAGTTTTQCGVGLKRRSCSRPTRFSSLSTSLMLTGSWRW